MRTLRQENKVEVIAAWDTCGGIKPLRLRFEDEHHQLIRLDIDRVLSTRKVSYVGIEAIIFLCRATLEDRERAFELKYAIGAHSWELMRWIY